MLTETGSCESIDIAFVSWPSRNAFASSKCLASAETAAFRNSETVARRTLHHRRALGVIAICMSCSVECKAAMAPCSSGPGQSALRHVAEYY